MVEINKSMTAEQILKTVAGFAGFSEVIGKGSDLFVIDGFTIKAVASQNYFHARNGERKIQVFYGSQNNTEESLKAKFESLVKSGQRPYEEMDGDETMSAMLEKKLGAEVTRYKRDGQILYRVKGISGFKSLSISEDGKSIHSCMFDDMLDSVKNVDATRLVEWHCARVDTVHRQSELLTETLKRLS